jgi:6-pyruvoyltetrahydropterin/6-carboxytetrahydropterin synthase
MELRVDGWSVGARFSVSHYIPHHEKCGRLHGHTYAVSCVFRGDIAEEGDMMVDFIAVKGALRELCDELDHHVLVPTENPNSEVVVNEEEVVVRTLGKRYVFPSEDVKLLPIRSTTAERLAEWFADHLLERLELPSNVTHVDLGIEEGLGQGAWAHRDLTRS